MVYGAKEFVISAEVETKEERTKRRRRRDGDIGVIQGVLFLILSDTSRLLDDGPIYRWGFAVIGTALLIGGVVQVFRS
jgi:hypothetical protein